jgi:hypothetical protein
MRNLILKNGTTKIEPTQEEESSEDELSLDLESSDEEEQISPVKKR